MTFTTSGCFYMRQPVPQLNNSPSSFGEEYLWGCLDASCGHVNILVLHSEPSYRRSALTFPLWLFLYSSPPTGKPYLRAAVACYQLQANMCQRRICINSGWPTWFWMRPFTWDTGQKRWNTDRKHFQCTGESKGVCGTKMSGKKTGLVCCSGIACFLKGWGSQGN